MGGLGLLQFPEVPWAPSFNLCEIEHGGLIHDQFPAEAILPFESTGRATTAGRSLLQHEEFSLLSLTGSLFCQWFEIRGPVGRRDLFWSRSVVYVLKFNQAAVFVFSYIIRNSLTL